MPAGATHCTGPSASQCVPTAENTTLCATFQRGSTCVAACDPAAEYADDDNVCLACSDMCTDEGCTGPTSSVCVACAGALLGTACVSACPTSHYLDEAGVCQRCSAECAAVNGTRACTGPGPSACLACAHVKRGKECVRECLVNEVALAGVCRSCHPQCSDESGCHGVEATQCFECAAFEFDGECVPQCDADSTYAAAATKECLPCHPECSLRAGSGGCPTGTSADDCAVCLHVRDSGRCEAECSTGYYPDTTDTSTALGGVCTRCHPTCDPLHGCTGGRADQCSQCADVSYRGQCVTDCPSLTFESTGSECLDCDPNCLLGCTGTSPDQCTRSSNVLETSAEALGCRHNVLIAANGVITCVSDCPVGRYADDAGVCRSCSTLCPLEHGCTGPAVDDCNSCPLTQYLQVDRTCADCSSECSQVMATAGCTGPEPRQCTACAGARYSGGCVDSCADLTDVQAGEYFATDTSDPDEAVCVPCHEQCAAGGCTGPGPTECLFGCKNNAIVDEQTAQVTCVASCGSNEYVVDTPRPRTCKACNSQCSGGCTDGSALTCNECVRFQLESGECVADCPLSFVADLDGVCRCPADRTYPSGDGTACLPCSVLCSAGCTGPLASQCKGGADGCTFAEHNGECVASCPPGMVRQDGACVCMANHLLLEDASQGCQACSSECANGCTGPTASDCLQCRNYLSGATCVAACAEDEHPTPERVCAPCHVECAGGCNAPGDAQQCVGCRSYENDGVCVPDCPEERYFVTQSGVCVAECPTSARFYNDTRPVGSEEPSMPQECVAACAVLGAVRNNVNSDVPYRCSTQAQLDADFAKSSGSTASLSDTSLTIVIAAAAVLFLVLVAFAVVLRRRGRGTGAAISHMDGAAASRTKINNTYQPGQAQRGHGTRDSHHYDVANMSNDSSTYIDPVVMDESDHMGGYLEVRPQNPYSMSDQAIFDSPAPTAVQSTRM